MLIEKSSMEVNGPGYNVGGSLQPTTIHSLPDTALLEVFRASRDNIFSWQMGYWRRQWWNLFPAHVCRRWRELIIASSKSLQLRTLCGVHLPIIDVVRHSPPVPLIIKSLGSKAALSSKQVDALIFALGHLDRLCEVSLYMTPEVSDKFVASVRGEAPNLEHLQLVSSTNATLPTSFLFGNAPKLREVHLSDVFPPLIRFPHVVKFHFDAQPEESFDVNRLRELIECIRSMLRLEHLDLDLPQHAFLPLVTERTSLPALLQLTLSGSGSHLQALADAFDAPLLSTMDVGLFDPRTPLVAPSLPRFLCNAPRLKCRTVHIGLTSDIILVEAYPHRGGRIDLKIYHESVDLGTSITTLTDALGYICDETETLVFGFRQDEPFVQVEELVEEIAESRHWRSMLKPFKSVKKLRIDGVASLLVAQALKENGFTEILPKVEEVTLFSHSFDDTVDIREPMQEFEGIVSEVPRLVNVSCKLLLYEPWLYRHDDVLRDQDYVTYT
ncbi:hypothetical protein BC834DRAFT_911470 [Gloeopeniophorella convolvens]|nr:hypothetical protein BC834DRAFT_911470 [Gloeopeniophorella convolvens]